MGELALLSAITLILFGVFCLLWKRRRYSLMPAFAFTAFAAFLAVALVLLDYLINAYIAEVTMVVIGVILAFIGVFGLYIFIALLFINARIVLKHERRTFANCLTLALAAGLTLFVAASWLLPVDKLPWPIHYLLTASNVVLAFYVLHVSQYLISVALCNLSRPKKLDYIVVLGCWLKDGGVTPLLAKRIDRAVAFYNKQAVTAAPPKLVMSGGKGNDESRSEAAAMAEYAAQNGVAQSDILVEDASVSTKENMIFSKRLIDAKTGGKPYKCGFATSNYHLLRAGIYARQAKLKAVGLGAKTALYYLPNALIREYIAYLVMHRKRHIALCAFVYLCAVAFIALHYALDMNWIPLYYLSAHI